MAASGARLENAAGAVELLSMGATLHRFEVTLGNGARRNIVLSREDPDAPDPSFRGASVGRFANRLAGASFSLDGRTYQLAANEGPNQLHGGPGGFSEVRWELVNATSIEAIFQLISPDGDQGFPGTLRATAVYSLIPNGVQVVYTATTDAATVVNLTSHPYFCLGPASIEDHRLTIHASHYTPVGSGLIPTGEIRAVEGLAIDLRSERNLGAALAAAQIEGVGVNGGLDHNFVVDGCGLREHLRLVGPDGLSLAVYSDAPGVQIYSGEKLGRAGLAIEPQGFPDAPNHDGFPSAVLRPGQSYRRTIQWLVFR